ncbi:MAG TPA: hypothetical protein VHO48_10450, partial [Anaerolineaceae bacterium]|nr:hypothetical protein [Anaerolineaceae bacterium]
MIVDTIRELPAYQALIEDLKARAELSGLALPRAARLPVATGIYADLQKPVLLLTDRIDHALSMLDELVFWAPDAPRYPFPEPNPIFYERGAWSATIRRDRLQALIALTLYHIPGAPKPDHPPIIIAPARALMTRTLPRRDMIKATKAIKPGQVASIDALLQTWIGIGYEPAEVVLEPGQFSRRGGILDIWPQTEPLPARLDFFGDEIDTLRHFDPASQRTVRNLDRLWITPAREVLPGYAATDLGVETIDEFHLPLVHPARASLLDYLPRESRVLIDDLNLFEVTVNGFEEQAVKVRNENIHEGLLPEDYPVPYLSWSELQDSLSA